MKKTEIIVSILAVLAFGLSYNFVPGGSIFTTLTLIFIAFLYFAFGFALLNNIRFRKILKKDSYKGMGILRIFSSILIGYALSNAVMGVLFGIMNWPGAEIMLLVALCLLGFFLILLLVEYLVNKSDLYKSSLPRMLIWGGLCILIFMISPNEILEFQFRNYPEYNQARKNAQNDPNNEELRRKAEMERIKIIERKYM